MAIPNDDELLRLLRGGESHRVEFKESLGRKHHAAAFPVRREALAGRERGRRDGRAAVGFSAGAL